MNQKIEHNFISREELCKILGISYPTLMKKIREIPVEAWDDENGCVPFLKTRELIDTRQQRVIKKYMPY